MESSMFVVLKKKSFEIEPDCSSIFQFKLDTGKMIGFLPIYATREDALIDFPDDKILEIREVKSGE